METAFKLDGDVTGWMTVVTDLTKEIAIKPLAKPTRIFAATVDPALTCNGDVTGNWIVMMDPMRRYSSMHAYLSYEFIKFFQ